MLLCFAQVGQAGRLISLALKVFLSIAFKSGEASHQASQAGSRRPRPPPPHSPSLSALAAPRSVDVAPSVIDVAGSGRCVFILAFVLSSCSPVSLSSFAADGRLLSDTLPASSFPMAQVLTSPLCSPPFGYLPFCRSFVTHVHFFLSTVLLLGFSIVSSRILVIPFSDSLLAP